LEKKFKLQAHAIYSTVYNICSDYFVLTTTFSCRTFHRQIGTNYCVFNQSINQSINHTAGGDAPYVNNKVVLSLGESRDSVCKFSVA